LSVLSDRLRALRDATGERQEDVAALLGVTAGALGLWEQGRRVPPIPIVAALARHYKVSTDYLIGVSDDPAPPNEDPYPGLTPARRAEITRLVLSAGGDEHDAGLILEYLSNKEMLKKAQSGGPNR
jgi:transcriptional regulator with XRE-family HTH domain